MERLVMVVDDQNIQWGRALLLRATAIARQINARTITSLIDERLLSYAEKKDEIIDSEIILWGRAEDHLLAAWTSVSPQSEIVNIARCQSDLGLVAQVFSAETVRSLEEPMLQAPSFTNLGDRRGKPVRSMRGLPILVFGQCIGALTWVGYGTQLSRPSGENNDLSELALILGRFSELKILKMCLGIVADL